ncbi:MAG: SGNH/GDSL hydrolase family protein [Burkholderiales bacterium]|nr:SGNH/GDSL hydrolase family protein [Phycisphaerae bacterium]
MTATVTHGQALLKDGDVLALCGDSITEQKQYTVFIEDYLRMCQPLKVDVMQFGWGGESSSGFLNRMKWDVLWFKPTIATTCYGMNDGGYKPIDDATRQKYRDLTAEIVKAFQSAGARVVVGSPGAVDPNTFRRGPEAEVYNHTLAALRDEARAVAASNESTFADVHEPLRQVTDAAKLKYGPGYHVCGPDGYHPAANGHLVMAYAFLKALGMNGEIGTINVDLSAGTSTASEGHSIAKMEGGSVTIESTRYPFCFTGDPKSPNATSGIIEFFPFNQDLNRLVLRVTGPAQNYKITWGTTVREYSIEQLKGGINLAADFIPNPFNDRFVEVEKKIREKQGFETKYGKGLVHAIGDARPQLGDDPALDAVMQSVRTRHTEFTRAVTEVVQPVTHTLVIEPVTP